MSTLPNGRILWQGPSQITGKPTVLIATGFSRASANAKTGDMLQTWILLANVSPVQAINTGADSSICGDCSLRGIRRRIDGSIRNKLRSCYVNVAQGPTGVYGAFQRGAYPVASAADYLVIQKRFVRFGSYGDPCAVPCRVWSRLARLAVGHTGYTHQWRDRRFWRFRRLVMASVETIEQARDAWALGWRTFRSMPRGAEPQPGEFRCPASAEAGFRMDCLRCNACRGANRPVGEAQAASVAITVHGSPAVLGSYYRRQLGN